MRMTLFAGVFVGVGSLAFSSSVVAGEGRIVPGPMSQGVSQDHEPARRVAMFLVSKTEAASALRSSLTQAATELASRVRHSTLLTADELDSVLGSSGASLTRLIDCGGNLGCIALLGQSLQVDEVLILRVLANDSTNVSATVQVLVIDARDAAVLRKGSFELGAATVTAHAAHAPLLFGHEVDAEIAADAALVNAAARSPVADALLAIDRQTEIIRTQAHRVNGPHGSPEARLRAMHAVLGTMEALVASLEARLSELNTQPKWAPAAPGLVAQTVVDLPPRIATVEGDHPLR